VKTSGFFVLKKEINHREHKEGTENRIEKEMKSYDETTEVRNETPLRQLTEREDNLFFVADNIN